MKPYETQLRDALSQAVGWIEECGSHHEGREFVLTEARAALKALQVVRSTISEKEIAQLRWLANSRAPRWGGHLERGEPVTDPLMKSMIERDLIELSRDRSGYVVTATGHTILEQHAAPPLKTGGH